MNRTKPQGKSHKTYLRQQIVTFTILLRQQVIEMYYLKVSYKILLIPQIPSSTSGSLNFEQDLKTCVLKLPSNSVQVILCVTVIQSQKGSALDLKCKSNETDIIFLFHTFTLHCHIIYYPNFFYKYCIFSLPLWNLSVNFLVFNLLPSFLLSLLSSHSYWNTQGN